MTIRSIKNKNASPERGIQKKVKSGSTRRFELGEES